MPASSTTAPGNVLASSSSILAQGMLLTDQQPPFGQPYAPTSTPVNGTILVPTNNLPTITLYLKLAAEYYNPNTQAYIYPALETWFTPLVQIGGVQTVSGALPLAAPILLPVERAVFYTVRGNYSNVGFNIRTDGNGGQNLAFIEYVISGSQ